MSGTGRRAGVLAVAALLLLMGCGVRGPTGAFPPPSPAIALAPTQTPPARLPAGAAVFAIVMENRSSAEALAQPYLAGLAGRYALATNYHAVARPSLPNYLALTSGSTHGIADDDYHALSAGGIGQQLTERGIPWRAYMEGLPADCRVDSGRYAVKHNPFAYYGGGCPSNVVGLTSLDADLAGGTSRLAWITPDLCHDGHDCGARTADDFLAGLVPRILASPVWTRGGVLIVTWDEDDGSAGNQVATVVAAPSVLAHRSARPYDHYSLLATIEDLLGVPRLGAAGQAQAMDDLV